jgi:hypothetical protein
LTPQVEKPISRQIVAELERLRVISPELMVDLIGQPRALLRQLIRHARPLTQLNHHRIVDGQAPQGGPVGAQRIG